MADKASSPMDEDIVKLRARVKELETELDRKEKDLEAELNRRDRYRDAKDDLRSTAGDRDKDRDRDRDRDRNRDRDRDYDRGSRDRGRDRDRDDDTSSSRRVANSVGDVGRSKIDAADRMVRGVTLASVEVVRGFADSLSSFADNVIRRNESRDGDGRTVRDMATRLPEDIATSMADTVDRFVDIPRRAADRYSQVHREGERDRDDRSRGTSDRDRDRDDRPRKTSDRDSTTARDNDKGEFRANVSVKT